MKGELLNNVLQIGADHALYREDGIWYHHLKKFPGVLFDKNGYLIFQTKSQYDSHPELQHAKDLHVANGISALSGYRIFSDEQKRKIIIGVSQEVDEESIRFIRQISVIPRNSALVKKIKNKYKDTCQICGTRINLRGNVFYSEVHHIKPLGSPHNGPDIIENMICVCPNHHVMLNFFVIPIEKLQLSNHEIKNDFLEYHNSRILRR